MAPLSPWSPDTWKSRHSWRPRRESPPAPAFRTGHGLQPSLDRNARYLPAWLTAPELCLPSSSGHLPGALAQLCKLAEHPPPESDHPGSRVLAVPERPGLEAGLRSPRPAASTFRTHVFQPLQALTEELCVPHFTPTPPNSLVQLCAACGLGSLLCCRYSHSVRLTNPRIS